MKKLLFVCAFVMGICAVSFAQGRQRQTPEESAAALKTSLTLNDDQTAKVKTIYEVQAKSMDSLRTAMTAGGDAPDRAAMMAKRTPITNATNAKIKAILTADQAATFQKQVDAQAERMKQFMQGGN
ncbi:hypothetical protein [Mucilaginibacter sp.]|uniref:hypothetical protein n=1 Tax=Mucilaginibacter sp. TaxID=1882438 RepID=UPI0026349510|nr:hypothetical protein [Mucilaginibacter sp.]MDB5030312.1 hypothetical protein [Mucilaginibacter sp.]